MTTARSNGAPVGTHTLSRDRELHNETNQPTDDGPASQETKKPNETQDRQTGERAESNNTSQVGLRERLSHFTWAWFTMTMSTGGIAIALHETPHQFTGLYTIGAIVFIFNIALFILLTAAMTTRLIIAPHRFTQSFTHPPECFFFAAFWLSTATIIACTDLYGIPHSGPWLVVAVRILFWLYAACSLLTATFQYLFFFTSTPIHALAMHPAWFLPNYSAMLTGTVAGVIAPSQPPEHRFPILVAGCAYEGLGWIVCLLIITCYFMACMQRGMPPPDHRPGMFLPVGAGGYTIVALILQARAIPSARVG